MNRWFGLSAVVGVLACSGPPKTEPPQTGQRDVRVPIPDADPAFIDVVTPEAVIPAGQERMFCTDLVYDGDDTAFGGMQSIQGKFGHHLVLLSSQAPKPPGTTYDCTDASSMKDYEPFAFPVPAQVPSDYGMFLPHGKPMVVQMHYVNTGPQNLLVRDVIRLKKMAAADVKTWMAIYVSNTMNFSVPPHATDVSVTFDCNVQQEGNLILLGGHMHQYGASHTVGVGPDVEHLTQLYDVPEWKPEYRDSPPTTLFLDNPLHITQGTIIRTQCAWNNTTDHELTYPEEMCTAFGLVAGIKDPVVCLEGK